MSLIKIVVVAAMLSVSSCGSEAQKFAKCHNVSGQLSSEFAREETIRHLLKTPKWGFRVDGVCLTGEEIQSISEESLALLPETPSIMEGRVFNFSYVSSDAKWQFSLALYDNCYSHLGYIVIEKYQKDTMRPLGRAG